MATRLSEVGERGFIRKLRDSFPSLVRTGDDSAVLDSLQCPVVTTDSFFESTHFHRWWAPPEVLGRRLLEAALSDLAAMGARPEYVLAALQTDPEMELEWLLDFYRGLTQVSEIQLVGGETVRGDGFGLTLTAIGEGGEAQTLMRRSGLKPHDQLWLTGRVGRALDAPQILEEIGGMRGDPLMPVRGDLHELLIEQVRDFLRPRAEVKKAQMLRREGVRCAIDVSDGLFSEAAHLAEESGVDVVLELDASAFLPSVKGRPLEAASAGEDFVLLFAADDTMEFRNHGFIRVGRAIPGNGRMEVYLDGIEQEIVFAGYDHMR